VTADRTLTRFPPGARRRFTRFDNRGRLLPTAREHAVNLAHPVEPPATPPPARASDAERNAVVERLHHALGEGRLDLAETEARVAAAYAACHRSDLAPLLADLPDTASVPSGAPAWSDLWTSLVWRARTLVSGVPDGPPTAAQCRTVAVLAVFAACWVVACAFLGAVLVAS
jgi:hypothetical protein